MPRMTMTDRSIKALQGRPGTSVDYFDARLPRFAMRITEKGNPGSSSTDMEVVSGA